MLMETAVPTNSIKVATVEGYLRITQAAKRLNVSTRTITRWIHKGYFEGVIKNDPLAKTGSFYLIPEESIQNFHEGRGGSRSDVLSSKQCD